MTVESCAQAAYIVAALLFILALAAFAILLASINVFGGFAVTRRRLAMFSRS